MRIKPYQTHEELGEGKYSDEIMVYTDSPVAPIVRIPFEAHVQPE